MNPDFSEVEALLRTPATLPLSSKTAAPPPIEAPQNAAATSAEAIEIATNEVAGGEVPSDETAREYSQEESAPQIAAEEASAATNEAPREDSDTAAGIALQNVSAAANESEREYSQHGNAARQVEIVPQNVGAATNETCEYSQKESAPPVVTESPLVLHFSPPPDAPFQSSLTLNLACASPTAQIRYALGAATVDDHGMLFDTKEKIFLTQTTLIAARAFEGGVAGPILSAKFEIQKPQWQELEPTEQSDATPHRSSEVCACPDGWQLAAGSVRGKLHAHRALWREDSFALGNIEAGSGVWSVIAVSDGAGSAPLSRVGSRLACAAVMESLRVSLGAMETLSDEQKTLVAEDLPRLREALVGSGAAALEAIRREAQTRAKPLTAFAATLLVLVRREWNGSQLCAALQVGDGAIALLDAGGLTLLGEADHGQHSSETRFLTTGGVEADLPTRVKFSIKNDLLALAVMSDGVSDDYFPEEKRLGEVFEATLPLVRADGDAGAALVAWLGYEKKGSSDDRTLVIGCRREYSQAPLQTEARDGETKTADRHA